MMAEAASVPAMAVGIFAREGLTCLGIDVQVARRAPGGECGWINYGTHDDLAHGLDVALGLVDLVKPLLEADGHRVGVRHDAQDCRVVFFQIPGDADDLGLGEGLGHA